MNDDDQRRLLSTAFERSKDGYVFYRNGWASGVPVSAEEREKFVSSDAFRAMQLGREYSKRRAVAPPRHASPWLVADAMPISWVAGLATVSIAAAAEGSRASWLLPSAIFWAIAIFLAAASITLFARRLFRGSKDANWPRQ